MKKILLLFAAGLWFSLVSAQVVTVRDLVTHSPLEFVAIYDVTINQHVFTDQRGRADISAFKDAQNIQVRLLGYATTAFSYNQLKENQFRVFLEPSSISLEETVISATRWKEERKDIPQHITTLVLRDVLFQNPQTAADLLSSSGKVFVQKSQMGGGSPMIRGFATNRVLITVDGVRMNNAIFRSGNIQNVISLDPLSVERTEVLFGPGAVMYGSDAIGGAMNFYTLQPQLTTDDKLFVKGSGMTRFSSANKEKTGHIDFNIGLRKWAFTTSATFSDFDDLKMGSHGPDEFLRPDYQDRINNRDTILVNPDSRVQKISGYSQMNFMQKIRFAPDPYWDFQYGFHYSASTDVPRYDRLIERASNGILRDGEWYYGPQLWMMNVLNINHSAKTSAYDKIRLTIAMQQFEESRHNRSFRSARRTDRTETVQAYSLNLDFDKKIGERNTLLYGVEGILNNIGSKAQQIVLTTGNINPTSTRYPDGSTWSSQAAYINFLSKVYKKVTFQTGLRYSHVFTKTDFDTTYFPLPFTSAELNTGALTGSAGIAYKPGNDWQLNLNFSTGFRAPNIDDIGKVFDSAPGIVVVPNPALKSEYVYNWEIGVSKLISTFLKFDITGYYSHLNDALVRRPFQLNGLDSIVYDGTLSKVMAIQNAAFAYLYGIQASMEAKLPLGFGINSRFTFQQGEEELDDATKATLRHSVPWFGSTHLTYSRNRIKADFYLIYQSEVKFDDMAPSEQEKPHLYAINENDKPYSPQWITLNVKAMYQITDFLMVNAGIENLSDLRYRPYSSGISAPGRNFVFSLRATF